MTRRRWTALPPRALRPCSKPRGNLLAIVGATRPDGAMTGPVVVPAYRRIPVYAPRVGVTDKWDQCGWADLRTHGREVWAVIRIWPFHYVDEMTPVLMVDPETREAVEVRVLWDPPSHRRTKPVRIHHEDRPKTAWEISHVKSLNAHTSRKWSYPPKWAGKKVRRARRGLAW